jgi:LacI family transcriptional regulator
VTAPTSHDVARVAGVSQSTVSRVLLGSDKVSPKTRERVLAALKSLDYAPNGMARAIRTQRTETIGVVLADLTRPFQPELLNAISDAADAAGQRVVFWRSDASGESSAVTALRERSVDGLIFTTASLESTALTSLLSSGSPVVQLNRGLDDARCDQVVSDNVSGGRRVAAYMARGGRRRFALIAGDTRLRTKEDRAEGFRVGLHELGKRLPHDRQIRSADDYREARRAAALLFASRRPPDAVFCTSDTIAFGAVDAARAAGLRLGHDVWIVGYNDTGISSWGAFDLTTVRQDTRAMAARAIDLLLTRARGEAGEPQRVVFPVELVVRGSTDNTPESTGAPGASS